ncbi:MAG: hypothetical protein LBP63_08975 [Prevotellaceae bacterium]|nr:hypothetical protein [Prevotellaceae bacterium]
MKEILTSFVFIAILVSSAINVSARRMRGFYPSQTTAISQKTTITYMFTLK